MRCAIECAAHGLHQRSRQLRALRMQPPFPAAKTTTQALKPNPYIAQRPYCQHFALCKCCNPQDLIQSSPKKIMVRVLCTSLPVDTVSFMYMLPVATCVTPGLYLRPVCQINTPGHRQQHTSHKSHVPAKQRDKCKPQKESAAVPPVCSSKPVLCGGRYMNGAALARLPAVAAGACTYVEQPSLPPGTQLDVL